MKILICGKGGSGKSTVTAMTARLMRKRGFRVLVVDADESNLGLHRLLGAPSPETIMDGLGGKAGFKNRNADPFGGGHVLPPGTGIDAVPGVTAAGDDGLRLAAIGKIHHFGEGCACPMGKLFRQCFSSLVLGETDLVLIDAAAGVEHFGRRLDAEADLILCVVDPSWEGMALAGKITALAKEAGAPLGLVLNRMDDAAATLAADRLDPDAVVTTLPLLPGVQAAGLAGQPLTDIPGAMDAVCDRIETARGQD
jgi:CO dehydrogenase maturation factor